MLSQILDYTTESYIAENTREEILKVYKEILNYENHIL